MSNMSEIQRTAPAGWYDSGNGQMRWWDGQNWGPIAPPPPAPYVPTIPISGLSVAGFVLACFGFLFIPLQLFAILFNSLALILSIVGASNKTRRGRGLGVAGIIISASAFLIVVVYMVATGAPW